MEPTLLQLVACRSFQCQAIILTNVHQWIWIKYDKFRSNAFITFALNFNAKMLDVNTLCVWAPSRDVHALYSVSMNLPGLTIDLSQHGTMVLHVICHETLRFRMICHYIHTCETKHFAAEQSNDLEKTRQCFANPRETLIDHCVEMNTKHRRQNRH